MATRSDPTLRIIKTDSISFVAVAFPRRERLTLSDVPQTNRAVGPGGNELTAAIAEAHGVNGSNVPFQGDNFIAVAGIPDLNGPILAAGRQFAPIGVKGNGVNLVTVPQP